METPSSSSVSTKQERIAKLAREAPEIALTSLSHHIDINWLKEAFRRTRKDGAPGIDGQTAKEYEAQLEMHLQSLLNRAKSGTYRAPAVKRAHIPKGNGAETRPIGIPTFEDKVLQRAVVMALEPVYEQDFRNCSYGFRPRRSAHQALEGFWKQMMTMGGGWVLEVDIRKFFDTLDHAHVQSILRQRVRDGVVVRLIGKWLNAGVMESGQLSFPDSGTPQGGVISPLLANIYLHEVLDRWFEDVVMPRLGGKSFLVRYADDFVIGFQSEVDARRVLSVLPKRFEKYGLTLHPTKTRLVPFRKPKGHGGAPPSEQSGSFDFLGFTHVWAQSYRRQWAVKRRTAKDRFNRALKRIDGWCKQHRHEPVPQQRAVLAAKLRGHYAYYGITGNAEALQRFVSKVQRRWHKWLARRSQRSMSWERFQAILKVLPLPKARVVHSALRHAANP